jgi:ribosomal protein S18 acetylase RimI-like enzyme/catechol 2,3-dioxygenase-like lactoylglutathione lyase family enzyme
VNIRILTSEDASQYRDLRLQALIHNSESFLTTYEDYVSRPLEQIAIQLDPNDDKFTLGAYVDNHQLAGTVTFIREKASKIHHIASVQAVFVAPKFRQCGVGRMLLSDLIRRVRQCSGIEQLKLSVVKDNTAAVALYKSLGFQTYGTERQALKAHERYWDELHMVFPFDGEERTLEQSAPSGVKGFSHVTMDVGNLEKSLEFYIRLLGMKLVHRGRADAYLEWGTAWICLQERPEMSPQKPQLGVDHVAFTIPSEEFHTALEVLRVAKVPILRGPVERGGGWTVNFLDPDGTQLEFHTGTLAERMETWT